MQECTNDGVCNFGADWNSAWPLEPKMTWLVETLCFIRNDKAFQWSEIWHDVHDRILWWFFSAEPEFQVGHHSRIEFYIIPYVWKLFLETTNKIELKLYKHITGWSFSKLYFDMNLKSKIAITGQKHWTLFLCGLLQILNLVRCAWLIPTLRKYLLMLNVFFKCPGFWTEPGNTWPS